ncbi:MAG: peptidoglycan editing factor PgeF [Simkaniaceae bacterium]|nr:peptidoglycan editing factor PgeF [Simkaniaceae bacterium]
MIRKSNKQIQWLEFELLANYPEISHGVFLNSLDFSKEGARNLAATKLGFTSITNAKQCHGDTLAWVDAPSTVESCDGLLTQKKALALTAIHADCQAAIFYDPITGIIANIHAGWRGSVLNIYAKTIKNFVKMGAKVENILVCISPSIGPDRFEFVHYLEKFPAEFHDFQVKPNYFDFWAISQMQLEKEGVGLKNIEIAKVCTYTHAKDFFSYRRSHEKKRHVTLVGFR